MAHHNYLIGHNTSPDRNKPNPSRLTALTPQNQPGRPLLRRNQNSSAIRPTMITGTHSLQRIVTVSVNSEHPALLQARTL